MTRQHRDNPAVERQAEDRTHRIGQKQPVNVYRYLMADTIEQRIHELLQRKADLAARIVGTASLDLSRLLTKDDLYGLLELEIRADDNNSETPTI